MLANNRRVRWLSASSPAQGGGPETGGAIAYPVNAKGSLRETHPPQAVLEAGVGAEDISLARDSVVDHVEPGGDAVHDCPEDRLV